MTKAVENADLVEVYRRLAEKHRRDHGESYGLARMIGFTAMRFEAAKLVNDKDLP